MNRLLILILLFTLASLPARSAAVPDDEVAAHKIALDLAGAFSNDGFKLRDGNWVVAPSSPRRASSSRVNLYAEQLPILVLRRRDRQGEEAARHRFRRDRPRSAGLRVLPEWHQGGRKLQPLRERRALYRPRPGSRGSAGELLPSLLLQITAEKRHTWHLNQRGQPRRKKVRG